MERTVALVDRSAEREALHGLLARAADGRRTESNHMTALTRSTCGREITIPANCHAPVGRRVQPC